MSEAQLPLRRSCEAVGDRRAQVGRRLERQVLAKEQRSQVARERPRVFARAVESVAGRAPLAGRKSQRPVPARTVRCLVPDNEEKAMDPSRSTSPTSKSRGIASAGSGLSLGNTPGAHSLRRAAQRSECRHGGRTFSGEATPEQPAIRMADESGVRPQRRSVDPLGAHPLDDLVEERDFRLVCRRVLARARRWQPGRNDDETTACEHRAQFRPPLELDVTVVLGAVTVGECDQGISAAALKYDSLAVPD